VGSSRRLVSIERRGVEDQDVEFRESGMQVAGEFRCASCGYGIVSRGALPDCPICRGTVWEQSVWRLFIRDWTRR
jgi:rubrerythrin